VTFSKAKVLKLGTFSAETPVPRAEPERPAQGARTVPKVLVDAQLKARTLLAAANQQASQLLESARQEAAAITLRAEAEGRADGAAALAAQAIALRSRELTETERRLDEIVQLARVLAERVLGEELQARPERIVDLARQALSEARGARRVSIEAHSDDIAVLEAALESLGVAAGSVQLLSDPNRHRGNLRVVTDVGVLDAALAPQLERLALKLRETLGR
jgi:flagellar assembly protein FliH